ncbi:MAG TPA: hypothetical protein PKD86_00815 [Gemmatales bacterium]|mgnify:CR=1 FL=1|nr:hypothetical protein [Gemmatales bacterium]
MMYEVPTPDAAVTQGDLFTQCPIVEVRAVEGADSEIEVLKGFGSVVELTQACDLAQGKVTHVVAARIAAAALLVESGVLKDQQVRNQIRRHQVYGWYFLPADSCLPAWQESLVDLRNLITLPLTMLGHLAAAGCRVGRLCSPYREHLSKHFADTYARIGLPEPYTTEP